MIELPDFVTPGLIERTHARAMTLKELGKKNNPRANALLRCGMNMARARHPKMLLFLEKAANHLQQKNQEQQARFRYAEDEREYRASEFSEAATWRTAYEKTLDPGTDERTLFRTWGWIYAAAAEALGA